MDFFVVNSYRLAVQLCSHGRIQGVSYSVTSFDRCADVASPLVTHHKCTASTTTCLTELTSLEHVHS